MHTRVYVYIHMHIYTGSCKFVFVVSWHLKSSCPWVQGCLWALSPADICCFPVLLVHWVVLGNARPFLQRWPSLALLTPPNVTMFLLKSHWAGQSMTHHCSPWFSSRLFLQTSPIGASWLGGLAFGTEKWEEVTAVINVPRILSLPQGHKRKNWKVRRFVLRKDPAFLHYYDPSKVSAACSLGNCVWGFRTLLSGA